MKKKIISILKIVLPLLLGIYLIWYFFSTMSEKSINQFYSSIKEANYFWIFLCLVIGIVSHVSRAYRWKYNLEPLGYKTPLINRYHAIMIGYVVNLTIPRAGEASRSAMLYRSNGVPFATSFGTIIAERVIDLVVLLGIMFLTILLSKDDFFEIKDQIQANFGGSNSSNNSILGWVFKGIVTIIILIFIYISIKKPIIRNKAIDFIKKIVSGVFSIFKTKNPFGYILHTIIIWGSYILMFWFACYAFEETKDLPFKAILLGFIVGTLGVIFTNGGLGVYPLLVGLVVSFYIKGEDKETAQAIGNAFGMIIWSTQTLLLIILGLISLILLPKNYKEDEPSTVHSK